MRYDTVRAFFIAAARDRQPCAEGFGEFRGDAGEFEARRIPGLDDRRAAVPQGLDEFGDPVKRPRSGDEIDQVCLDYVEETITGDYSQTISIKRKWVIFLALRDSRTIPVAAVTTDQYAPGDFADLISRHSAYSEELAARICELTGKMLVRMPSVPGRLHTFVESVDQIFQRRLAHLNPGKPSVATIPITPAMYQSQRGSRLSITKPAR